MEEQKGIQIQGKPGKRATPSNTAARDPLSDSRYVGAVLKLPEDTRVGWLRQSGRRCEGSWVH